LLDAHEPGVVVAGDHASHAAREVQGRSPVGRRKLGAILLAACDQRIQLLRIKVVTSGVVLAKSLDVGPLTLAGRVIHQRNEIGRAELCRGSEVRGELRAAELAAEMKAMIDAQQPFRAR
jgi:hypothetical protein